MNSNSPLIINSVSNDNWDVIVVGAGAAGLMTCLELPSNLKILLLNRNQGRLSSSRWAQGGMAAVVSPEDSLDSHFQDTIEAGAGLCDEDSVRMFVDQAPDCIRRLQKLGMEFDKESAGLISTTLEAAHSHRRVLHVKDRTGRALIEFLLEQVERKANIVQGRGARVTQLWVQNNRCSGVQVLEGLNLFWISSRAVVLATGGGGHLFANTTNPSLASGEGLSLAWNAGAVIEDLEFVQFHPTALKIDGAPCFLLSEALRGEGAVLTDQNGNSPIAHLKGVDLAPRDQVSKALVEAMNRQNVDSFGLDLSPISRDKLESRFPTIINNCRELGLDPLKNSIPVAPAAHYWMGGVSTDMKASTTVSSLYAVGEVAATGLHGANRLASNSLMECIVFARQMSYIDLRETCKSDHPIQCRKYMECNWDLVDPLTSNSIMVAINNLRQLCWKEAGVTRSYRGMHKVLLRINKDLEELKKQPLLVLIDLQANDEHHLFTNNARRDVNLLLDLRNRLISTKLLFQACLFRGESRGGHFRSDFNASSPYWRCHSRQQLGKQISTRPVRD